MTNGEEVDRRTLIRKQDGTANYQEVASCLECTLAEVIEALRPSEAKDQVNDLRLVAMLNEAAGHASGVATGNISMGSSRMGHLLQQIVEQLSLSAAFDNKSLIAELADDIRSVAWCGLLIDGECLDKQKRARTSDRIR
ncbi:MAG: hypothetical protein AB8B50_03910 [Pirellulaceae bacterium]